MKLECTPFNTAQRFDEKTIRNSRGLTNDPSMESLLGLSLSLEVSTKKHFLDTI